MNPFGKEEDDEINKETIEDNNSMVTNDDSIYNNENKA